MMSYGKFKAHPDISYASVNVLVGCYKESKFPAPHVECDHTCIRMAHMTMRQWNPLLLVADCRTVYC